MHRSIPSSLRRLFLAMRSCLNVKDNVCQDQTERNYITFLIAPGHGPVGQWAIHLRTYQTYGSVFFIGLEKGKVLYTMLKCNIYVLWLKVRSARVICLVLSLLSNVVSSERMIGAV